MQSNLHRFANYFAKFALKMQTKCKLKNLAACREAYTFAASSKVRGMKVLGLVLALIHYSFIKT